MSAATFPAAWEDFRREAERPLPNEPTESLAAALGSDLDKLLTKRLLVRASVGVVVMLAAVSSPFASPLAAAMALLAFGKGWDAVGIVTRVAEMIRQQSFQSGERVAEELGNVVPEFFLESAAASAGPLAAIALEIANKASKGRLRGVVDDAIDIINPAGIERRAQARRVEKERKEAKWYPFTDPNVAPTPKNIKRYFKLNLRLQVIGFGDRNGYRWWLTNGDGEPASRLTLHVCPPNPIHPEEGFPIERIKELQDFGESKGAREIDLWGIKDRYYFGEQWQEYFADGWQVERKESASVIKARGGEAMWRDLEILPELVPVLESIPTQANLERVFDKENMDIEDFGAQKGYKWWLTRLREPGMSSILQVCLDQYPATLSDGAIDVLIAHGKEKEAAGVRVWGVPEIQIDMKSPSRRDEWGNPYIYEVNGPQMQKYFSDAGIPRPKVSAQPSADPEMSQPLDGDDFGL